MVSDNGGTAYVNRTGDGRIIELVRYNRGIVTVERDQETAEPTFRIADRVIPTQDALHLRSPLGRAPLSLAREAIGVAIILERHAARLFARGARPSGVLSFVNGMKEEAIRKTRAAWQSAHEGEDAGGKTAVLHDGATFTPLTLTSTDAQFLELRKFQILEIARAFRVPPSMLFELDRATWSNSEQMGREFLTYCLEPWLIALESAMRRALFLPEERERFVIRFDRDDLTRADLTARATAINSLIASRVISPNEGRAWIGLAPREGGDAFQNPNITPEKPAPAEKEPADA
ncbi:MAG: phage portal protein [Rhodovulum sp.]|nr:phage portal protein [Rhodovulum sp.]